MPKEKAFCKPDRTPPNIKGIGHIIALGYTSSFFQDTKNVKAFMFLPCPLIFFVYTLEFTLFFQQEERSCPMCFTHHIVRRYLGIRIIFLILV